MYIEEDLDKFPLEPIEHKLTCKFCGKPIFNKEQGRGIKHLSKDYIEDTFCKCRINYSKPITFIN
jgi:hypothetical protein